LWCSQLTNIRLTNLRFQRLHANRTKHHPTGNYSELIYSICSFKLAQLLHKLSRSDMAPPNEKLRKSRRHTDHHWVFARGHVILIILRISRAAPAGVKKYLVESTKSTYFASFCVHWGIMHKNQSTFHKLNVDHRQVPSANVSK